MLDSFLTKPMFYIIKNNNGDIQTISRVELPGSEAMDEKDPQIAQFFARNLDAVFSVLDTDFFRVLEDLIDTLIEKNVIHHTDLPVAAQQKLLVRKGLRSRMHNALNLLGKDDPLPL